MVLVLVEAGVDVNRSSDTRAVVRWAAAISAPLPMHRSVTG